MKKLMFVAAMAALCMACQQKVEEKTASQQLLERLTTIQKQGYMFGHQDDTFYGLTWEYVPDSSDILATVGDYPAVMGFDLGGIEMGDAKNLDSVPFTRIREELVKHHLRGGIVTISWHPRNPVTGGTAWDVEDTLVVHKILTEDSVKAKFNTWMTRVGDFIETLRTDDGKPVPIIFRPWHEYNGSWFWWDRNYVPTRIISPFGTSCKTRSTSVGSTTCSGVSRPTSMEDGQRSASSNAILETTGWHSSARMPTNGAPRRIS